MIDPTALAGAGNAFGLELYRRIASRPGNLILSPASVASALTMTWGGARGRTAQQMSGVLRLDGSPAEVIGASAELAASLQDPSRPLVLRLVSRLFGEMSYRFEEAYLTASRAAYGAALEPVGFRAAADAARARINGWVEEQTERRIAGLVPPGGVDADTRLVLVNAIYFLADWAAPFESQGTRDAPFFVAAGESKPVRTMNRVGGYRFADDGAVKALELRYRGHDMSMLVLLPRQVDGIGAVEESIDASRLGAIVGSLRDERVLVSLPRFDVSQAEPLSLGRDLAAMGMADAFSPDDADFTGIADPPDPADRLFIARVFHKAFVRVDEKGTEAAAASALSMAVAGSAAPQRFVEFKADHPFLFLIRDDRTGLVLFIGRVMDPSNR